MSVQLADAFSYAFELPPRTDKATLITVGNAGNWKALYPILQEKLNVRVDATARHPVVFGGDEAVYLKQLGAIGAAQFKQHVLDLLNAHDKIFVFDTQKIECLRSNPSCISDLLFRGKCISLFYRDAVEPSLLAFVRRKGSSLYWEKQSISKESLSVISTQLSAQIMAEAFKIASIELSGSERDALKDLEAGLLEIVAPEIEDHLLAGSFGVPKLRELARRKVIAAALRVTTPSYSLKSGRDPIDFFREELAERFKRYELPTGYLVEVSPYLSFVVKSQGKYADLKM